MSAYKVSSPILRIRLNYLDDLSNRLVVITFHGIGKSLIKNVTK